MGCVASKCLAVLILDMKALVDQGRILVRATRWKRRKSENWRVRGMEVQKRWPSWEWSMEVGEIDGGE